MKKYPCIENTLEFLVEEDGSSLEFRLWFDSETIDEVIDHAAIENKIRNSLNTNDPETRGLKAIFEFIHKNFPKVNAAQVRSANGNSMSGVMVYYVDF